MSAQVVPAVPLVEAGRFLAGAGAGDTVVSLSPARVEIHRPLRS